MYSEECTVLVEVQTSQNTPWKCVGGVPIQALSVQSLTTTDGLGDVCGTQMASSSQQVVLRSTVDNIVRSPVEVTVDLTKVDIVGGQRTNETLLSTLQVSLISENLNLCCK